MKTFYSRLVISALTILTSASMANAQCGSNTASGTFCNRSATYHGEILPDQGCGTFTTVTPYSPGTYFRTPVLPGACYSVSTCGAGMDTQIGVFQGTATTNPFSYNDDNGPICSGTAASVTFVPTFNDYVRVDVRQYNCSAGGTSSITTRVRQNNNLVITSSSADMCAGETRTLTATPTPVGTALAGAGDLGTFSGVGVSGTTFTAPTPAGASATYDITYTYGYCSTVQSITVYNTPSTADAGLDQPEVCDTTTTLQGNNPTIGTGTWAVVSGTAVIANPNDPYSGVSGLIPGSTVTLSWTIANGPCTVSTDNVTLIIGDNTAPVADILTLSDITAECEVTSLTPPTATDNCAGTVSGTHNATLPITAQGTTVVTWTYDDGNGNTSTQMQNVIIADTTGPIADSVALVDMIECNSAMPVVPTATDNCSGSITGTPDVALPVTTPGLTVITWTFDDGNGNISTQSQNITINTADASVTQNGATLTANATSGTFQWLDCDNNYQIIAGETNASYTPMAINGNYAVEVTNNGCVDTSACYNVDYTGVKELVNGIVVSIYPNPSTGKFEVKLSGLDGKGYTMTITDLAGRQIIAKDLGTLNNEGMFNVDISDKPSGVYLLNIDSNGRSIYSTRIVKE